MQLRYYQQEAIDSIGAYFQHAYGNPVVALPTGTGKSVVIGGFHKQIFERWPGQRFLNLTHVKELIGQNYDKLTQMWPSAPAGIFSAGLRRRDTALPIIFGGIQSVAKNPAAFGHRDLILVDECHLIGPKDTTLYRKTIDELKRINPALKVVGFTATNYRMGHGELTDEGGIFTHTCYDRTGFEAFNRFIEEGFLAPLIPKQTNQRIDTSNVSIDKGEFSVGQLEAIVDDDRLLRSILEETCTQGWDRKSWLVFTPGVASAEHTAKILCEMGVAAVAVHSKLPQAEADRRMKAFRNGEYRAMVGNNKFTTGFDHPPVDLIVMLRSTMSSALWVQMLGRGTRPWPGKENCLVLDFAGNTRRCGPINDPIKPKARGDKTPGVAPIRLCDECGVYNHASSQFCINCGHEFYRQKVFGNSLDQEASTDELIKTDAAVVETFTVDKVVYLLHQKQDKPESLRVDYYCGGRRFSEYMPFAHGGKASGRAKHWWNQRAGTRRGYYPATSVEALNGASYLTVPRTIRVHVNTRFPKILSYEF